MNFKQIKTAAKEQIKGKIGILFVISLIISVCSFLAMTVLNLIPIVGSLIGTLVVTPAFTLSTYIVYTELTLGYDITAGKAFSGFSDFWCAFKVSFLTGLFTFLWSLLFVIPGIIKAFSYYQAMYILADNEGKPALECISESKEMMNGHKMELFVLGLSFIGWVLLGIVTFFIGFIWITPYMQATFANFYRKLKEEKNHVVAASPEF